MEMKKAALVPVTACAFVLALAPIRVDAFQTDDDSVAALETFEIVEPDGKGLRRDTLYFLGYQWAVIGLLYLAPESVSGWTDEDKEEGYDFAKWRYNVSHPQWDSDDFYLNYIVHPYWGASYYVRARERGYGDRQAFWYSFLLSCIFEFGAEALAEPVSIQDFFVTPIAGTILGRYFMNVRADIRTREADLGYRKTGDKWLWVLTDPLGAMNRQVDKLFRRDVDVQLLPYRYVPQQLDRAPFAPRFQDKEPVYGIQLQINW
jgi:hypothetical protein